MPIVRRPGKEWGWVVGERRSASPPVDMGSVYHAQVKCLRRARGAVDGFVEDECCMLLLLLFGVEIEVMDGLWCWSWSASMSSGGWIIDVIGLVVVGIEWSFDIVVSSISGRRKRCAMIWRWTGLYSLNNQELPNSDRCKSIADLPKRLYLFQVKRHYE